MGRTLRAAAAGAAAAGLWAAVEPGLRRFSRSPHSEPRLVGRMLAPERYWLPVGLGVHVLNGAVFGVVFDRLGGRGILPGGGRRPDRERLPVADAAGVRRTAPAMCGTAAGRSCSATGACWCTRWPATWCSASRWARCSETERRGARLQPRPRSMLRPPRAARAARRPARPPAAAAESPVRSLRRWRPPRRPPPRRAPGRRRSACGAPYPPRSEKIVPSTATPNTPPSSRIAFSAPEALPSLAPGHRAQHHVRRRGEEERHPDAGHHERDDQLDVGDVGRR